MPVAYDSGVAGGKILLTPRAVPGFDNSGKPADDSAYT